MNIKILPSADADLVNGYHFYEAQAQGLGGYFRDSLFSDIDSLIIYHGIHVQCFGKYYKMLSKRFPFAIYYTIEGRDIVVYSVLDCRRNPAWINTKFIRRHEVDMGNLALKDMSVEEKIATMETLWDDLCQHHHIESPSWHGDVLQQRDASRQQGNEEPINWEEAKQDILKKTQ